MNKLISGIKRKLGSNLVKDYMWVFIGQNAGSVFSMLTLVITLRVITTAEYGILTIIQTYCLLISNLFSLRTFNGLIKYATDALVNDNYLLVKKYINTSFVIDFGAGIFSYGMAFALLVPITKLMEWDTDMMSYVYLYMPIIILYPLLNGAPVGILRKLGYFKQVNLSHAIVYGIQFIVILGTYILGISDFKIILLEYLFTEIIECLVLVVMTICILSKKSEWRGFMKAGFIWDWDFMKYNIYYGLISTFDQILGNASTLLINKYVGNLTTAYLKIITKICSLLTKLTKPVGQIFYPELCKRIADKRYKSSFKISIKYFLVVLGSGLGLMFAMYITYDWWIVLFDVAMVSAKWQSMLYLLYTLLSVSIICINQLMLALSLVKQNLIIVLIADVLYMLALIPCVKMLGVNGYLILQILQLLAVVGVKCILIKRNISALEEG